MPDEEPEIIKNLRIWYKAILQRAHPSDAISARSIITDCSSLVQSTLPEVFPELTGSNLWKMLRWLKAVGELDVELFFLLDRVRSLFGQVKYQKAIPNKTDAEQALLAFGRFLEWLKQRLLAKSSARINDIWYEHNIRDHDGGGVRIGINFEVDNMRGRTGTVYAHFYYDDQGGELLNLRTEGDPGFRPPYAYTVYTEFSLFLPYDWLAYVVLEDGFYYDPRDCAFKFNVEIWDDRGAVLVVSNWRYFTL